MKRGLVITAVAAAAVIGAIGWAFAPRPLEVETARVWRGRFEQSIEEDGRTRLRERYTISAPAAARLARIRLREGDPVHAGDVVAQLTPVMPSMVDERSLREANARLKAAEAAVTGATARVDRARISQEEARFELQRTEKLARDGFVSASRFDSARLALDGTRRELEASLAAREVAAQERAQAAAMVQPAARNDPGTPLPLRAPVSGVVLRVPILSEATVAAGTALLEVGDPSQLEVVVEMLTQDAVLAKPGTRVVVERWGGPSVEGRVRRVEPAAFTKVSALGVEEQRVNVIVDLSQSPEAWAAVGDGFRVTARVITATADDAVQVPVGALFPAEDGVMAAFAVEAGRAVLRPLELSGRGNTMAWVRAGLQPGELVIVYPPPGVADGRRVRARQNP
ncbi:efflux RND transporter periplasmic adaptor subunit [Variovorax sp. JS1663]|uniref:efflux RND transporter periplasmic adaptor subunit n=1 Tax=Variovorax sp. JS1663 TaxID=1851577 RepID=UPI000B348FDF|nr:HlyD family efflux transporter periplasmic adaptor subunit [Variovorax sp. JS1663]OUM00979.1 efflux transporter periplasmic adaptor subunit [Variovorax sp. JS1663]